jgi:Fe2+ transport system protein FeoA
VTDGSTTLDLIAVGGRARVESLAGDGGLRLAEMGLIPGATVEVARVAPMGDPIDVVVLGYHLSLRLAEARGVCVVPVGNGVCKS